MVYLARMSEFPSFYVVTTPKHATEIPECRGFVGNIIDFMRDCGGGAVIVKLTPPRGRARHPRFDIQRVENGPDVARRSGWQVADYPKSRGHLVSVGGRIETPLPASTTKRCTAPRNEPAPQDRQDPGTS